ncbi:competence protein ComK [Rossellomorea sp. BNER]|jgi:competence protein ComK|uniref:competence protein ComK n=1 Tax=Rossellomorea sp. BNER TaxID=2962031 RepID=UPI003AF2A762|nr:competence protein ComK [Rossellomorea sp. BNER]
MVNKSRMIEEYEINPFTMVLLPDSYGLKTFTKIIELHDTYTSPYKPIEILKKSCEYFGSSFEGRKNGTRRLTGVTHKAPIIVDPHTSIYFFPTTSPTKPECFWIAHEHVASYERVSSKETMITFRNQQPLKVPISYSSFEAQFMRTSMLRIKFSQRIDEMEKKAIYQMGGRISGQASEWISPYFLKKSNVKK